MKKAYESVSSIIDKDDVFFGKLDPEIYVYGSAGIGTINKPYKREEYDLDFAVGVDYDYTNITRENFLEHLYKLLNTGRYEGKVKKLRFCVRIEYANQFHMDIMPGCAVDVISDRLRVPDTKKLAWAMRNLKGYMEWFQGLFISESNQIYLSDYYEFRTRAFLDNGIETRAQVEEMPEFLPYDITQPLQRAVQLLKRRRDIYFEDNVELKTSSVILTTIAGMFYKGESSISETIDGIVLRIVAFVSRHGVNHPIEIINPADRNENEKLRERFSDKWKEGDKGRKRYDAFLSFILAFKEEWEELKSMTESPDELLQKMFGENVVREANEQNIFLTNALRVKDQRLRLNRTTGSLTTAVITSKSIPKTTMDGKAF
jgi:sRNA-binding regulator protein Hfq